MKTSFLVIDIMVLMSLIVASNATITGIGVHEWLGLAAILIFLVHSALHMGGYISRVKSTLSSTRCGIGRLILSTALFLTLVVCGVSGIMESGDVLQKLGLYADGYFFWNPLHAVSAKVLLALTVVHLAAQVPVLVAWFHGRKAREACDGE